MRLLLTSTITLAWLLLLTGCRKENIPELRCDRIRTAVLTNDKAIMEEEINRVTTSFRSQSTAQDEYGHEGNINKLVQMLNEDCGFSAVLICYGCIYTGPPQSEVSITVPNGNSTAKKTIDLSFDRRGRLVFRDMHN